MFNQTNNQNATANGVVENLQIVSEKGLESIIKNILEDIQVLKDKYESLKKSDV